MVIPSTSMCAASPAYSCLCIFVREIKAKWKTCVFTVFCGIISWHSWIQEVVNENLHENMLLISHMKTILRKSVIMNWETWRSFVWITVNTETTLGWQPAILVWFSSKYKVTQQHTGRNAMLLWNTAVPSSDNTIQDNTGIQFYMIYFFLKRARAACQTPNKELLRPLKVETTNSFHHFSHKYNVKHKQGTKTQKEEMLAADDVQTKCYKKWLKKSKQWMEVLDAVTWRYRIRQV